MRLLPLDQETGLRLHAEAALQAADVESQVLDRLSGHDLWRAVAGALADEARQVVYLTFAVGLTRARFTGAFPHATPAWRTSTGSSRTPCASCAAARPSKPWMAPGERDTRRTPTEDSLIQPGNPLMRVLRDAVEGLFCVIATFGGARNQVANPLRRQGPPARSAGRLRPRSFRTGQTRRRRTARSWPRTGGPGP